VDNQTKSRFGYTEKEMADAFMELLQAPEGLPGIGPFDGVCREVTCRQGRPDFIAYRKKKGFKLPNLSESLGFVGSVILANLKSKVARTFDYLVNQSEFSEDSIRRTLRRLITSGYVKCTKTGSYRLGNIASQLKAELWVFELKLDNPKRAIFQAQQSRVYSNHVMIIVPPGHEERYTRYRMTMTRWGIGIATFDPINNTFILSRRSRNNRYPCQQHQIYALCQMSF
jgi:hypothetical protein